MAQAARPGSIRWVPRFARHDSLWGMDSISAISIFSAGGIVRGSLNSLGIALKLGDQYFQATS